jgi:hypothetical protein
MTIRREARTVNRSRAKHPGHAQARRPSQGPEVRNLLLKDNAGSSPGTRGYKAAGSASEGCMNAFRSITAVLRPKRKADYPNSQDVGSAIGLCSLIRMKPLTMRISDHRNHQSRIGMPISTMLSTNPIVR